MTFTASYIVDGTDVSRGYLQNTATATGNAVSAAGDPLQDLNGDPISVTDTSDAGTNPDQSAVADPEGTETPDGLGGTDTDPTNDPTVTTVPTNPIPGISVIKSVASVVDNGDGLLGAGDTVNYSFVVTNTGNVDLGNVTVTDLLVPVIGGPISLAIGESDTTSFTAAYPLTPTNVTDGGVENTAEASGGAVNSFGAPILDGPGGVQLTTSADSDAGTEPQMGESGTPQPIADPNATETPDLAGATDGDPSNDPTVLFIPSPGMSVIKSLASALDTNGDGVAGGIGDVLTYSFTVTNTGNTPLAEVEVTDMTATVLGGPISLAVGEVDTDTFTATYPVTADDVNITGYVENTAIVFGEAVGDDGNPLGNPVDPGNPIIVSDTSDTGTDPTGAPISDPNGNETPDGTGANDGDPTNDPTVTTLPELPEPAVNLIKSVGSVADTDLDGVVGGEDDVITFAFTVANTGNTRLDDVVVTDPLLGGVIQTIPTLAAGTSTGFTVDYLISDLDQARGYVENTASVTGSGVNATGAPLLDPATGAPLTATDDSDTGTDRAGDPILDPAGTETPDGVGVTDGDSTNDPTVFDVLDAVPDTAISGIVYLDADMDGVFGPGDTLLPDFIVQIRDDSGTIIDSTTTDADGFYEMSAFPVGTHDIEFVDPVTGEVIGSLDGLTFDRNTVLTDQNQAVESRRSPEQLTLTKTTPLSTVVLGGTVPYQITISNATSLPVTADINDRLPVGLVYLPGSATIDSVAVEPTVSGRSLIWEDVLVDIGSTVTLDLIARVGPNAPVGELVNTVSAFDADTGELLSNVATASVRRNPEAVFDCSDVIGKVFDDRNFDGYQNPEGATTSFSTRGHDITDQTYDFGKFSPAAQEGGEPGLPHVRLVTPTGTIITTDEYGRFSVPCAEMPAGLGTNFTLKLDPRSLPTGYRVTTENPRTMRLTAGIMTEMNFGAALGRVIDLDLTAAAFDRDNAPVERLEDGMERILQEVTSTPSVLRISYFSEGEARSDIKERLDLLEEFIHNRWRDIGRYRLIVERDVKYLQ